MSNKKQKLELTWIGKESCPKLEPRILLENPGKSYYAKHKLSKNDIFDNKLIFEDNLLALKALEQEYAGKVKRVFIDPPFNTGSAFTHYDDGIEHSIWMGLLRDRLEIIHKFFSDSGSLWVTIDDNEPHYLKAMCDEIFGRKPTEQGFIYITTQTLSISRLAQLSEDVGPKNTLLVLCLAFRGNVERFSNLTVKKIPKQVFSRCEWGHADYSLRIENLPKAPPKGGQMDLFEEEEDV